MSRSLTNLGKICIDGPFTSDIMLARGCADDQVNEIFFPDDFEIDKNNISLVSSATVAARRPALVTITFGGTIGDYAHKNFKNGKNFDFEILSEYSGEGIDIEITGSNANQIAYNLTSPEPAVVEFLFISKND
jgi:hypothetical protein